MTSYQGNHPYNTMSVALNAPRATGVYFCGAVNASGNLVAHYIGRSVSVHGRLLDHLRDDRWPLVTHFGFILCGSNAEAIEVEAQWIEYAKPTYNKIGA